ncbi:MAG: putative drug exporter of the superfamily [Frankiaceae bacterium]|nr:putative drug exporter of the superfamily [Frankiaceae bacterium]
MAAAGAAPRRWSFWHGYARVIVGARWLIVAAWAAAVVAILLVLPPVTSPQADLEGFVSGNSAAAQAEKESLAQFGVPLLARSIIVQRNPAGLPAQTQADAVARALAVDNKQLSTPLLGAVPLPNTGKLVPGAKEDGTTVLTFVFPPAESLVRQDRDVRSFADQQLTKPADSFVGVTGSIPARVAQSDIILAKLPLAEVATVLVILLIVALSFRSAVAPLVTLATGGVAVLCTLGALGHLARFLKVTVPSDLEPLIIALLLGVTTDYCVFFLSGMRNRLREGLDRRAAAIESTADVAPIVAVAGVTVAAGTASLLAAHSPLFRGFGPGLGLTVLVGLLVASTLGPALLAILGPLAFWPSGATHEVVTDEDLPVHLRGRSARFAAAISRRGIAGLLVVVCVGALAAAAWPVTSLRLGVGFISSVPSGHPVAVAANAAAAGFADGVVGPTQVVVNAPGIATQREKLKKLEDAVVREPGVAAVVGAGDLPPGLPAAAVQAAAQQLGFQLPAGFTDAAHADDRLGISVSKSGDAARFLVIFDSSPLDARAITHLRQLTARLPSLLAAAGLSGARPAIAGDTALAAEVVARTTGDLLRIAVAALLVNALLLVIFLRAIVAPLVLLSCSVLALLAALGLTSLVFQTGAHHDGITFYVPFAAAVLLVSLGSDYNIFAVGHVWTLARRMPLAEAIRRSTPRSTRAITSAGLVLAASFGLLALVPLVPFRELAFAMATGILLDVFLVRSVLVPSLLTLLGTASGWPWAKLQR